MAEFQEDSVVNDYHMMHDNPLNNSAFFQFSTSSSHLHPSQTSANRVDHLKLLLYDLNSAIAPQSSRRQAIFAVLDEFDHHEKRHHDQELDVRADQILLQKLTYALSVDETSDEVGYLCHALEMVYRGSKGRVEVSFGEVREALLPLLVEMIRAPTRKRKEEEAGEYSKKKEEEDDGDEGQVSEEDLLRIHHHDQEGPIPYEGGAEETKHDQTVTTTDDDDAEEELASALAAAALRNAAQQNVDALKMEQQRGQDERQRQQELQRQWELRQQQQQQYYHQQQQPQQQPQPRPQPFYPQQQQQQQQQQPMQQQQQQQQQQLQIQSNNTSHDNPNIETYSSGIDIDPFAQYANSQAGSATPSRTKNSTTNDHREPYQTDNANFSIGSTGSLQSRGPHDLHDDRINGSILSDEGNQNNPHSNDNRGMGVGIPRPFGSDSGGSVRSTGMDCGAAMPRPLSTASSAGSVDSNVDARSQGSQRQRSRGHHDMSRGMDPGAGVPRPFRSSSAKGSDSSVGSTSRASRRSERQFSAGKDFGAGVPRPFSASSSVGSSPSDLSARFRGSHGSQGQREESGGMDLGAGVPRPFGTSSIGSGDSGAGSQDSLGSRGRRNSAMELCAGVPRPFSDSSAGSDASSTNDSRSHESHGYGDGMDFCGGALRPFSTSSVGSDNSSVGARSRGSRKFRGQHLDVGVPRPFGTSSDGSANSSIGARSRRSRGSREQRSTGMEVGAGVLRPFGTSAGIANSSVASRSRASASPVGSARSRNSAQSHSDQNSPYGNRDPVVLDAREAPSARSVRSFYTTTSSNRMPTDSSRVQSRGSNQSNHNHFSGVGVPMSRSSSSSTPGGSVSSSISSKSNSNSHSRIPNASLTTGDRNTPIPSAVAISSTGSIRSTASATSRISQRLSNQNNNINIDRDALKSIAMNATSSPFGSVNSIIPSHGSKTSSSHGSRSDNTNLLSNVPSHHSECVKSVQSSRSLASQEPRSNSNNHTLVVNANTEEREIDDSFLTSAKGRAVSKEPSDTLNDEVMHIRGGGMDSQDYSWGDEKEQHGPRRFGLEKLGHQEQSFKTTFSSDFMDLYDHDLRSSFVSDLGESSTSRSAGKLTAAIWKHGRMQDIQEQEEKHQQFTDDTSETTAKQSGSFVSSKNSSQHILNQMLDLESEASMNEERDEARYPEDNAESNTHDLFHFSNPDLASTKKATERYQSFIPDGERSADSICPYAVRKVLKILRYFSRILSAMVPMAQQYGLVEALLYQITKEPHSIDNDDDIAARVDALAVIVNLACAEENKISLCYHPGLLETAISTANNDPVEEAREYSAIILMNLAYAEEVKEHMVNQDHLLDTLLHLLYDVSPFTRRYASAALFTLACVYANTSLIASYCSGGILEALRRVLLNDPVDEARINAAEALFNLARNNAQGTVEIMGNHPKLLASLGHSVITDYSPDVRAYAARALEWLAADIHYPMACHGSLLKALTTASGWTKISCIAEAFKLQSTMNANRKHMVDHPGLLDALAKLALLDGIDDEDVRVCAIYCIERLTNEPSTRGVMVKNEGIMTALTRAAFHAEYDDPSSDRPTAVLMKNALKNLAAHL